MSWIILTSLAWYILPTTSLKLLLPIHEDIENGTIFLFNTIFIYELASIVHWKPVIQM